MKILFVTGTYLPIKNGGIENYTHQLALLLLQNDFGVEVAALDVGDKDVIFYEGIKVNNLRGSSSKFNDLLCIENYDICHFHEYSAFGGIELHWFKMAKEKCKKVYFTFHLPYFTCYKNDFRYNGQSDCDVFNDAKRCTNCIISEKQKLHHLDQSYVTAKLVNAFLVFTGKKQKLNRDILVHHHKLTELIDYCDSVFLIAGWFKNILENNGYKNNKLKLISNNLNMEFEPANKCNNILKKKLIFVGRIQHQKGLHLLCEAMSMLKTNFLEIDVFGNIVDEKYFAECKLKYSYNYKGIIARQQLLKQLQEYDFLILPSVFTEMYPMVIQEAFHFNLPVIASAAKGNKDAIEDGVNGFLFEYDNAKDLARTIDKAYHLKLNGWEPEFKKNGNPEKNIEEMLSYYVV